jgi:HTH-type transcriptional regulator/antitoxin HipB
MPTVTVRNFRDLAAVIRASREARGIRQEDLAEELGLNRYYLAQIENGKNSLVISRLFRIMRRLGITLSVTYTVPAAQARHD